MKVREKRKNVVDKTDLAAVIGTRLRNFRKEAGLTLKQLAEVAELSVPLLSKIENGAIMPSVPALQALAVGLRIEAGDFFRNKEESGFVVSQEKDRKAYITPNADEVRFLFDNDEHGLHMFMEPAVMTVAREGEAQGSDAYTHEGQEFAYVLEGKIELSLGNKKIRLNKGDAAYWESTIVHAVKGLDMRSNRTIHVHLVPGRRSGACRKRVEARGKILKTEE